MGPVHDGRFPRIKPLADGRWPSVIRCSVAHHDVMYTCGRAFCFFFYGECFSCFGARPTLMIAFCNERREFITSTVRCGWLDSNSFWSGWKKRSANVFEIRQLWRLSTSLFWCINKLQLMKHSTCGQISLFNALRMVGFIDCGWKFRLICVWNK